MKIIEVFTTRPDTIFGATYIILSPEHSFVKELLQKSIKKKLKRILIKPEKNLIWKGQNYLKKRQVSLREQ